MNATARQENQTGPLHVTIPVSTRPANPPVPVHHAAMSYFADSLQLTADVYAGRHILSAESMPGCVS